MNSLKNRLIVLSAGAAAAAAAAAAGVQHVFTASVGY
jgi:hypothetical protein